MTKEVSISRYTINSSNPGKTEVVAVVSEDLGGIKRRVEYELELGEVFESITPRFIELVSEKLNASGLL